jgi:hypothetical protein
VIVVLCVNYAFFRLTEFTSDCIITTVMRGLVLQFVVVFSLVSWGGVRLSPLGTSATIWPIVPAPDDR